MTAYCDPMRSTTQVLTGERNMFIGERLTGASTMGRCDRSYAGLTLGFDALNRG
jgi:hypothetical protein